MGFIDNDFYPVTLPVTENFQNFFPHGNQIMSSKAASSKISLQKISFTADWQFQRPMGKEKKSTRRHRKGTQVGRIVLHPTCDIRVWKFHWNTSKCTSLNTSQTLKTYVYYLDIVPFEIAAVQSSVSFPSPPFSCFESHH